jgi:hypothetical protein
MGSGGSGGFSARRSTLQNMGLYGGMPALLGGAGDGRPRDRSGDAAGSSSPGGDNPDRESMSDLPTLGESTGVGQDTVPLQYRKRVGEYFRRITREWND